MHTKSPHLQKQSLRAAPTTQHTADSKQSPSFLIIIKFAGIKTDETDQPHMQTNWHLKGTSSNACCHALHVSACCAQGSRARKRMQQHAQTPGCSARPAFGRPHVTQNWRGPRSGRRWQARTRRTLGRPLGLRWNQHAHSACRAGCFGSAPAGPVLAGAARLRSGSSSSASWCAAPSLTSCAPCLPSCARASAPRTPSISPCGRHTIRRASLEQAALTSDTSTVDSGRGAHASTLCQCGPSAT